MQYKVLQQTIEIVKVINFNFFCKMFEAALVFNATLLNYRQSVFMIQRNLMNSITTGGISLKYLMKQKKKRDGPQRRRKRGSQGGEEVIQELPINGVTKKSRRDTCSER